MGTPTRKTESFPTEPVSAGQPAPQFTLPAIVDGSWRRFGVDDLTEYPLSLVVFAAFDDEFPSVEVRDFEWFQLIEGVRPVVVTNATCAGYRRTDAHRAVDVPLLSDATGYVGSRFGVSYDESSDESPAAVVLIDERETVRAHWRGDGDPADMDMHSVLKTTRRTADTRKYTAQP